MPARTASDSSSPSTIDHEPPDEVTGNELTSPAGTPYSPRLGSATDTQSPSRVPSTQSRTWSTAADAALAADDAPRAAMIAAPRFATVGAKVRATHAASNPTG